MNDQILSIVVAADHGGVGLKNLLKQSLLSQGYNVLDVGCDSAASCDYPDFAHAACAKVASGEARYGILVCGSGIGMSIAANRHPEIRCALLHDVTGARLTRAHNDANVIALGARTTGEETALDIVKTFLSTPYEGGRHDRRIAKITPAEGATS
jgi:ribose 5-phosphate isomerase B